MVAWKAMVEAQLSRAEYRSARFRYIFCTNNIFFNKFRIVELKLLPFKICASQDEGKLLFVSIVAHQRKTQHRFHNVVAAPKTPNHTEVSPVTQESSHNTIDTSTLGEDMHRGHKRFNNCSGCMPIHLFAFFHTFTFSWNVLHELIHKATSFLWFKTLLKTHFFHDAYNKEYVEDRYSFLLAVLKERQKNQGFALEYLKEEVYNEDSG
ncbi:hypothetical protein UY3_16768 [Chelonia mydas]|uniref:Uncharacterized protein n=1 Tax=Chelonia mydas TaxID=8469 RepID=M7ANK4_CHEMY|nr:hypothetical protein UY3_16768 [Chelonia mydas]